MELQKITNKLQDLCHEGESCTHIKIKLLDAYYDIGKITKVESGNDTFIVVDAEV